MQKIEKFWLAVWKQSLKKSHFGPNLANPAHRGSRDFFENRKTSLFYNYAVLTLCKKSKTSGARILRYQRYGRMDERTEEAEFVGPFRLKQWVQKKL